MLLFVEESRSMCAPTTAFPSVCKPMFQPDAFDIIGEHGYGHLFLLGVCSNGNGILPSTIQIFIVLDLVHN